MFATPLNLLESLRKRFELQPTVHLNPNQLKDFNNRYRTPINLRIVTVIKKWIGLFWFAETDDEALPQLNNFIFQDIKPIFEKEAGTLLDMLGQRREFSSIEGKRNRIRLKDPEVAIATPPQPLYPKSKFHISNDSQFVNELDPIEMARQLTIIEYQLFSRLNPIDLLVYKPDDKSQTLAAEVRNMIKWSNQVTGFVAESVISEKTARKRAIILKYFIKVAERCFSLNNFATLHSILTAMHTTAIYRLKRTWECVPSKAKHAFDVLSKLVDRENNFHAYRASLKVAKLPCIPFLGIYLTDIIFLKQGNPERLTINVKLINVDKFSKLAAIISEITRFQSTSYNLIHLPDLLIDLKKRIQSSQDVQSLHAISLLLEPRKSSGTIVQNNDKD